MPSAVSKITESFVFYPRFAHSLDSPTWKRLTRLAAGWCTVLADLNLWTVGSLVQKSCPDCLRDFEQSGSSSTGLPRQRTASMPGLRMFQSVDVCVPSPRRLSCRVRNEAARHASKSEDTVGNDSEATAKACKIADEIAEKVKSIEEDPSIPVRGSKAKGTICAFRHKYTSQAFDLVILLSLLPPFLNLSSTLTRLAKKETREKEHAIAAQRLANLASETKVTEGKWLFYPKRDNVDDVWEKIARAIVEEKGALHKKVSTAKVSPAEVGASEEVCKERTN